MTPTLSLLMMVFEQEAVRPSSNLIVRWETTLEDPYHDLRSWDFLALHRTGTPPSDQPHFHKLNC